MAKEWILNSAMNRFQLNFKRNVGATSESIRQCAPKTIDEWREYYFKNVRSKEQIEELGKKLVAVHHPGFLEGLRKNLDRPSAVERSERA